MRLTTSCYRIPSVLKTGLILFEIVRLALNNLVEEDNSVLRNIQYLQANMIWIDTTAFCGYKRKMEIAEHSLQPLVTALRRAGKFDRVVYANTKVTTTTNLDSDKIHEIWQQWVQQESYKRLVHHLFEHDISTTIVKARNPLISYAEMTLPLPASRDLWLAPTAEAWNTLMHENRLGGSDRYRGLSLRELLAEGDILRCLPEDIDKNVAQASHLHGIAAQSWALLQQNKVIASPFASGDSNASTMLWLQAQRDKLYV